MSLRDLRPLSAAFKLRWIESVRAQNAVLCRFVPTREMALQIIGGVDAYARQWALEGPRCELPLPSVFGYRGHWQLEGPGRD